MLKKRVSVQRGCECDAGGGGEGFTRVARVGQILLLAPVDEEGHEHLKYAAPAAATFLIDVVPCFKKFKLFRSTFLFQDTTNFSIVNTYK